MTAMRASVAAPRLSFRRALISIVVLALIVRVVVIVATPHFSPVTDSADYDRIAVSLADHGHFPSTITAPRGPTAFRPPLFPLALAGAYEAVGTQHQQTRWTAGRVLEAVLGAITVALTCLIALRLFGPGVSLLAGLIAALYPPLTLVGSSLMSESLFIPLVLAAVLAALQARSSPQPLRWAVIGGAFAGLAALTRGNGIFLVPGVCLLVWSGDWRWTRRPAGSRALQVPLAALAAALLVMVPWTVRNWEVFGHFVPGVTETGYTIAGTYDPAAQGRRDYPAMWVPPVLEYGRAVAADPTANEAQLSSTLTSSGLRYIKAHPASLLKTAGWSALRLFNLTGAGVERWAAQYEAYPVWLSEVSVYAFWIVGALALVGVFAAATRAAPWTVWLCPVLLLLSTLLVIGLTRYRSPADPFIVILATLGLGALGRRMPRRRLR
jgi:4-amino-4-deoxy-L-arabinose transferase-like glycosyltransferase